MSYFAISASAAIVRLAVSCVDFTYEVRFTCSFASTTPPRANSTREPWSKPVPITWTSIFVSREALLGSVDVTVGSVVVRPAAGAKSGPLVTSPAHAARLNVERARKPRRTGEIRWAAVHMFYSGRG